MIPIQAALLIYSGMLLESKPRREQLTKFLNLTGAEIEKTVTRMTKKSGEPVKEGEPDEQESTEFR